MVDAMPDLGIVPASQCFPRYRYPQAASGGELLDVDALSDGRIDNISDTALSDLQKQYGSDINITKDDIFYYIYGLLHASEFCEKFAYDLSRELPRITFADDFCAFVEAGRRLADLHLGYETCPQFPLQEIFYGQSTHKPNHYLIGSKAMRLDKNDSSVLIINDHLRLEGIPPKAHEYRVNGRTPLEWFIDRYKLKNGSDNDPNDWFKKPQDLIGAIRRIVYVSVESASIIAALPSPFPTQKKQPSRRRRG